MDDKLLDLHNSRIHYMLMLRRAAEIANIVSGFAGTICAGLAIWTIFHPQTVQIYPASGAAIKPPGVEAHLTPHLTALQTIFLVAVVIMLLGVALASVLNFLALRRSSHRVEPQEGPPMRPPTLPEFVSLNPYPLELVEPPEYKRDSSAVYRDKVYFKLRNKWDAKADIWTPFWESKDVPAQAPLGSSFFNLGSADTEEKKKERVCATLLPYETIKGWIGLMQPSTGGDLDVRVKQRNTGRVIIPVKSGGKLRLAYLEI